MNVLITKIIFTAIWLANLPILFNNIVQNDKNNIYQSEHAYKRVDGSNFKFKSLNNKVVLLDVWASWCAGCIEDHQLVVDLKKKINHPDFEVVYVNTDNDASDWEKLVEKRKWTGISIALQRDLDNPLSKIVYHKVKDHEDGRTEYSMAVPNYFLINKQGEGHKTVSPGNDELEKEIRALLKK